MAATMWLLIIAINLTPSAATDGPGLKESSGRYEYAHLLDNVMCSKVIGTCVSIIAVIVLLLISPWRRQWGQEAAKKTCALGDGRTPEAGRQRLTPVRRRRLRRRGKREVDQARRRCTRLHTEVALAVVTVMMVFGARKTFCILIRAT